MTIDTFLSQLTRLAFIALFLLSLLDNGRYGGTIRRDICLMFATITIPMALSLLNLLLPSPNPLLSTIGTIFFLFQPYLMLHLLSYFQEIPRLIHRAALVALVASELIFVIYRLTSIQWVVLLIIFYFVACNFYSMQGFIRAATVTKGVVHQRLRFTAVGAGLFAFALLLLGIGLVLPNLSPILNSVTLLVAFLAALAFYLGLMPFRWLRQSWQLFELQKFITQLNISSGEINTNIIYQALMAGAKEVTGAMHVQIVLWNHLAGTWTLFNSRTPIDKELFESRQGFGTLWQEGQAMMLPAEALSKTEHDAFQLLESRLLYFLPIERNQQKWGLLIAQMKHGSLFPDDDLNLLKLFVEQCTTVLENVYLLNELSLDAYRLEKQVAERTAELNNLNQELEKRVEERTAHLHAVNQELEAFSYSVSHDLRAPLRAVDGFSQVLLEDYEAALDAEGRDYLHLIRNESQRMGQLIDDLINLSRFTRSDIRRSQTNLSIIAEDVVAQLEHQEPERKVNFLIQKNLMVCADSALMRVVLTNLIGNAWKYSRHIEEAKIEFGAKHEGTKCIYFVRDNGVGFDMAYVHKLFGAFQRLHGVTEFEGTGIGLATVQRIIHRHGGIVWAEGMVNEGASFYFTLGNNPCDTGEKHDA